MPGTESEGQESYRFPLPDPDPFKVGYGTYLSPFTFRYGSAPVREIFSQRRHWSEVNRFWLMMAAVQHEMGLVSEQELANLREHIELGPVSVERIFQIERDRKIGTGHDYNAASRELNERASIGGKKAGQGATSEDPGSNVEVAAILQAFPYIRGKLKGTISALGDRMEETKNLVCIGATHLQVAEPTTYGYRLAKYAQDLLIDLRVLDALVPLIKGKGLKGAVGTGASFVELVGGDREKALDMEREVMGRFGLDYYRISDQTYPRKGLLLAVTPLMHVGQSLHRFALDLQLWQSSWIDEVSEPRNETQLGSFAMPHKQNPVNSENIDSLTEMMPGITTSAWITAAFVTLERTLRDSAGKRDWLPEAFLVIDESLMRAERVIRGMRFHRNAIARNMRTFAPYAANEILLNALTQAGMRRIEAHGILHEHSLAARGVVREKGVNPLRRLVLADERVTGLIGRKRTEAAFREVFHHTGNASLYVDRFLQDELRPAINS